MTEPTTPGPIDPTATEYDADPDAERVVPLTEDDEFQAAPPTIDPDERVEAGVEDDVVPLDDERPV